ncbi:TlyA family RNA methyltransferase [Candidatus Saccharibacteria bacterium]|nr:TlyA family RNA methyltransferase [Candidatus Saccharibacteria bacterium]
MDKKRLDEYLFQKGYVYSRSQAENYIKLGKVTVDNEVVKKPATKVSKNNVVILTAEKKYVSRAGMKLESVAEALSINFANKAVLDVGSSTGGFTDYALQHGASKVIAVDVGKNQMDRRLQQNPKIELHEQTDIRVIKSLSTKVDYAVIDVSFISIREVLKHLKTILNKDVKIVAMVKPQFESKDASIKHKGVIKNESLRRKILSEFEVWAKAEFKIIGKSDSSVHGEKGNRERFYLLSFLR